MVTGGGHYHAAVREALPEQEIIFHGIVCLEIDLETIRLNLPSGNPLTNLQY